MYLTQIRSSTKGKLKSKFKLLKFKVPKAPQIKEQPNKKIHEIKDPEMKYFSPASVENAEFRLKLART